MSEYVRFIQRIGLVGLTNILISLSSLIFIPIITKSFTTAEYGMWAQVNTTIALVPNIANLGLPYTMVRFLSAEKDKEKISAIRIAEQLEFQLKEAVANEEYEKAAD